MRKPAPRVIESKRPVWRKRILCNAIALAGAGLQAPAALAAPCNAPPNQTATCTITGGGTATIASDGSLIVPDADAIVITGAGDKSITNMGEIEGSPIAIRADSAATGNITINNLVEHANDPALILGASAGVWINSGSTITLTTQGTITAESSNSAAGIYFWGDLNGSIANNQGGTISAAATAAAGVAHANGIYVAGNLAGSVVNTGTLNVAAAGGAPNATAFGVYVGSIVTSTGTVTNNGQILASANALTFARAAGMFFNNEIDGGVASNSGGAITATAVAQSGTAFASGLQTTGGPLTGSLTNNGVITVTASNTVAGFAWASGMGVSSAITDGGSLINSNQISAVAGGGSASIADGIVVNSVQPGGSVTNSGTIDVTIGGVGGPWSSSGHLAVGIFVGDFAGATLLNSGTIMTHSAAGPGTGWAIVAGVESSDGSALVRNSGALSGNVHLDGTSMINTGLLSIPVNDGAANLSSFVGGNYTQSGNGILEIGAFSKDLYGRIEVTGTADLTASGRLAVNVSPNDALVRGERLDNVLHAGILLSGGNTNLFVTDNSPFWSFTALDDGENGIDLVVSGQSVPVMTAQSSQVANLTLDELSGLVMGRMDTRRLINVRGSHDQNLWFRPFGTSGSQDDDNNVPGYDIDSYGVVIGYDAAVSPEWNGGAAFAYAKSNVESNSSQVDDKIDSDSYSGSMYAYWSGTDGSFVDLLAIGGWGSNDSTRSIGVVGDADGNYDSWFTRLSSAIGRGFAINDKLTVSPIASVTYTYVSEDSYTESGTSGLNLDVDSSDAKSLIFGLDGQLAYQMGEGSLLTAHVGGGYDALTDEVTVNSSFVGGGAPFETKGAEPDEWLLRAGVGAEMVVTDRVEVHVNYEYEYRDTLDNNLLMATLRFRI